MKKAQARGVEALARQARHGLPIAVHGVPQNRVADIGQMDPDLVGTARLQPAAQVGDTGIPGQHLPMGDGGTSAGHHRHLLAVLGAAADGGVNGALVLPQVALDQALVDPGEGVVLQLGGQPAMDVPGAPDGKVFVGIRPEGFEPDPAGTVTCGLDRVEVLGRDTSMVCTHPACQAASLRAIVPSGQEADPRSATVRFRLRPDKVFLFHRETEERVPFDTTAKA